MTSFAAKIALSLFVAAGCACELASTQFRGHGDLWARGLVAGAMMSAPLALNVAKWKRRARGGGISSRFPRRRSVKWSGSTRKGWRSSTREVIP